MTDARLREGKGEIELREVTKRYGGEPVVDGVSVTIRPGEFGVPPREIPVRASLAGPASWTQPFQRLVQNRVTHLERPAAPQEQRQRPHHLGVSRLTRVGGSPKLYRRLWGPRKVSCWKFG